MKPSERIDEIYDVFARQMRQNKDWLFMSLEDKVNMTNEAMFKAIIDFLDEQASQVEPQS